MISPQLTGPFPYSKSAGTALREASPCQQQPCELPLLETPALLAPLMDTSPNARGNTRSLPASTPETSEATLKKLGIQTLPSTRLPNGNRVDHYVLKNGHQVLFERRPDNIVSLRTFIRVGSANENAVYPSALYPQTGFKSGIAHLDEHCHFLTTQNFPKKNEWVEHIEAYGVSLNASTSDEEVQHELHFNREDLPSMLQLHAEQVLHPHYEAKNIDQERKNVLNEASERLESSTLRLMDKGFELMFDRPVSYQTLGSREDVKSTTAEDLDQFFKTFYTPTNMLTVLSGNVNPSDVLPLMNKEFGHAVAQPSPVNQASLKWALKPKEIREQTYIDPKLSGLSLVLLGFEGPKKKDVKGRALQEILEVYLTGDELSPLNRHLVDEQHLAMDVSMANSPQKQTGMSMFMMHSFEGHEQKAAQALMNELLAVGQTPMTPEKLQAIKETLIIQHKMSLQHGEDSSFAIGTEAMTGSMDYLTQYEREIQKLQPEDVQAYAQCYLKGDSYVLAYALPGEKALESQKTSNVMGVLPSFQSQVAHTETPELSPPLTEGTPTAPNSDQPSDPVDKSDIKLQRKSSRHALNLHA